MKNGLRQLLRWPEPGGEAEEGKRINPLIVWVLLGAIIFLAISSFLGDKEPTKALLAEENPLADEETSCLSEDYVRQLEERLAEILKKINGAGTVSVFINIESGGEKVLATDRTTKSNLENIEERESVSQAEEEEKIVLRGQSAEETPYVIEERLPEPVGVLVVAEGAKEETVRYEMYEAVRALFGLSAHRIKITY